MSYYAVRIGKVPGIYNTWTECEAQVKGYPGASYKKFKTKEEAMAFISDVNSQNTLHSAKPKLKLKIQKIQIEDTKASNQSMLIAYVDGSYNVRTKVYGYGCVIMDEIGILEKLYACGNDAGMASMRNVAGEILGCQIAVQYAIDHGYKEVNIYYDYEGIEKWANLQWKTNKIWTREYKEFIADARKQVQIKFHKVEAHTGDTFNETADLLAKQAVGIQ